MNYQMQDPNIESYDQAVELLYASASRQKRSYIKHFVRLLAEAGGRLRHVAAVPRALGLSVVRKMEEIPQSKALLRGVLKGEARAEEDELAALKRYLDGAGSLRRRGPVVSPAAARKAKTTFRLARPEGEAKCTVSDGRVELKLARD
ncbi:MAG: replication protein, partial [Sulfitobacter sp.]|nr:replication protein [Sulfitobacter sp.]